MFFLFDPAGKTKEKIFILMRIYQYKANISFEDTCIIFIRLEMEKVFLICEYSKAKLSE
jgi:hypothetical protein